MENCTTATGNDVTYDISEMDDVATHVNSNMQNLKNESESKDSDITSTSNASDVISGLNWSNGVGVLPGTDMKFRINDSGEVEMLFDQNDDGTCDDIIDQANEQAVAKTSEDATNFAVSCQTAITLPRTQANESQINSSKESDVQPSVTNDVDLLKEESKPKTSKLISQKGASKRKISKENTKSIKEQADGRTIDIAACAFCGKTANVRTFWGRFCSKQCVGRNAARHRVKALKESVTSRKTNGRANLNRVPSSSNIHSSHEQQNKSVKIRRSSSMLDRNHNYDISDPKRKSAHISMSSLKKEQFSWEDYLAAQHATAVPSNIFKSLTITNLFPSGPNVFEVGWLMEAVDPQNQSVFALVSVVAILGQRLRLHFEGYPSAYDCWVYTESYFIFPCGFCAKTGRTLSPPFGYDPCEFNLMMYAHERKLKIAPEEVFPHKCYDNVSGFNLHDRCEAVDRQNPDLICVASIADILNRYVLVHFDGWDPCFDYWTLNTSNYIKPIGWCVDNQKELSLPLGYDKSSEFSWNEYLSSNNWEAADRSMFIGDKHGFKTAMKLEVVDPRNPILLRVASIGIVDDYRVKVHFDGWSADYDLWIDADNPDLHPIHYSAKAGEELLCPTDFAAVIEDDSSCPVPCCLGHGHVMRDKFSSHHSTFGCPYSTQNMHREPLQERLMFGKNQSFDSDVITDSRRKLKSNIIVGRKRGRPRILSQSGISRRTTSSDRLRPTPPANGLSTDMSSSDLQSLFRSSSYNFDTVNSQYEAGYLAWLSNKQHQRELSTSWEKHALSLPGVRGKTASEVSKWTIEKVASFVNEVTGKDKCGNVFTGQEIDGEAFLMLTQSDISSVLKLKLGPSVKIFNAIVCIKRSEA